MTSENIVVKPTVVDDIEFYIAPNGEAGMSLNGLARLCGIDPMSLRKHVKKKYLTIGQKAAPMPENADPTEVDDGFDHRPDSVELDIKAFRNARVIRDDVCAEIIEYYAFDSEYATEDALFSYRKFARLGIRAWIHQLVGYAQAHDNFKVLETLNAVLSELKDIKADNRKYKAIRAQNDVYFAGLNDLMDEIADTEVKALPSGDEEGRFTVAEWLQTRGITLDKSQLHKLAAMAAFTYRTLAKKDPTIVYRHSTQSSKTKKVNGYLEGEFPILSIALTKLFQP